MHKTITVRGSKIKSEQVHYFIKSDNGFSYEEIKKMENMTESEFIRYAEEHNIELRRKDRDIQ